MPRATSLLAVAMLPLLACEPEPTAVRFDLDQLVVHGVVAAADSTATVVVTRIGSSSIIQGAPAGMGVTDARVTIAAGADTIVLSHVPGAHCRSTSGQPNVDQGCYIGKAGAVIEPGVRYDLTVELPGHAAVKGSAVVPHPPVLGGPAPGTRIVAPRTLDGSGGNEVIVSWSGVDAAAHTEMRLRPDPAECGLTLRVGPLYTFGTLVVTGSGAIAFSIAHIGCSQGAPAGEVAGTLMVSTYDANYSRYMRTREGDSVRGEDAAIGITGAWGVFGAVASTRRAVLLVPPQ